MSTGIIQVNRSKIMELSGLTDLDHLPKLTDEQRDRLDGLGRELETHFMAAMTSRMLFYKAVFDAKQVTDTENWLVWLAQHNMSRRSGYECVELYERFGTMPDLFSYDKSKLLKMLTLEPGTEQKFLAENNIDDMTVRETDKAVKTFKGKDLTKDNDPPKDEETPKDQDVIAKLKADYEAKMQELNAEVERLKESQKESIEAIASINAENSCLKAQQQTDATTIEMLNTQLATANNNQLDALSATIRSFDGPKESSISATSFALDVSSFIGKHATMVNMELEFANMKASDKNTFREQIEQLQAWLNRLMNTVNAEQMEVIV